MNEANAQGGTPAAPLCPVHRRLEDHNELTVEYGNNCVACSLHERTQMLRLLAPFAPEDGSQDSLTVLRAVIRAVDRPAAPPHDWAEKKAGLVVSTWMATPERHYADLIAAVRDVILEAQGVAVPQQEQIFKAIEDGLKSYRCTHTRELADPDLGSALIDVLRPEGDSDVTRGQDELDSLVDYVCGEVLDVFRSAAPQGDAVIKPVDDATELNNLKGQDVFTRPECPFHYCDQEGGGICKELGRCRHK